jgi:integrase
VLVFTFGQTIDPKNWNKYKQRVKSNKEMTTKDGKHSLNDLLDNLSDVCMSAYNAEIKNGIPEPTLLKKHLEQFISINSDADDKLTLFSLADRFINNEIHHKGRKKAHETVKKYFAVKNHLLELAKTYRYNVDFETITLDFYYNYNRFLASKGLKQNTVAKDIQVIKVWMNEAVDLGYKSNLQFKSRKFSAKWEDVENVYLSDVEIRKLFTHDFTKNRKLERVRDLFVFGCSVGPRFSDFSQIRLENIVLHEGAKHIKVITKKASEQVIIPYSDLVLEIFEKYKDSANLLPRTMSNQKFNEYLKEVCRDAKMNEAGRLISEPKKLLWECVTSHTARRSFATNVFLSGFPTLDIMKLTGHRIEKAFLKYIKVSKLDTAKRLSNITRQLSLKRR